MSSRILLVALAACGAPPRAAPLQHSSQTAPRAPSIAGEYHVTHPVRFICDTGTDGWCEEDGDDVISIRDTRDGAISVSIEITQTNIHTCNFEGELAPAPGPHPDVRRWTFRSDEPCELVLDSTRDSIAIHADGCREYCGARAALEQTFPIR